jgi:hypothetical protein
MSVKHTPGPWEARERALDFGNINSLPCVEISAPDRKYWAVLRGSCEPLLMSTALAARDRAMEGKEK